MTMALRSPDHTRAVDASSVVSACPSWCVAPHGLHDGEEDWVHTSEPLPLVEAVTALLCMTIDPETDTVDGPYVLIGSTELTPGQASDIGLALQALAGAADSTVTRAAL